MLYPFVMLDDVAARSSVYKCSLKRLNDSEGRKDGEIDRPGTTLRLYSSVPVCNFCMYTPFRAIKYRILGARLFNTSFWKISLSSATEVFIADLIACSTCFGHHYAHHQELKSIIHWLLLVVFCAVVFFK